MAIRSEYVYDSKRKCYVGGVDLGSVKVGVSEDTLATEALVFMVVGLMGHWKQAIGYFLINKISADTQAQLVQGAITLLNDCGMHVRAVVCDGCNTNQATARILGCNLDANVVTNFFPNPVTGQKVYFLLDACHLIKNVRNTLGDKKAIRR
ncbi:THAP domain-containing protein, partial [Elysia marginata]